jgi:two-component system sensor histidine kinase MprB
VFELMRPSEHRFDEREIAQVRAFAGIVAQTVDTELKRRACEQSIQRAVNAGRKMRTQHRQRLAVARHELRNYFARLRLQIELLLDPERSAEAREIWGADKPHTRALRTLDTLDALASSLLTDDSHKSVEAGSDFAAVTRRVAAEYRCMYEGPGGLDCRVPDRPCFVASHESAVERAVSNLLDNAIKYSPRGGRIRVTVAEEDAGYLLEVTDHGIGFPREMLEHIAPFRRGTNAVSRQIPGMGLGLHVARELAEAAGGALWIDAHDTGPGTTVSVWLPRAQPKA